MNSILPINFNFESKGFEAYWGLARHVYHHLAASTLDDAVSCRSSY